MLHPCDSHVPTNTSPPCWCLPQPLPKKRKSRAKPKDQHKQHRCSTPEHDTFLEPYLPHYKEAQTSHKFEQFWKEVNNAFNENWLPEDAGERKKVCMTCSSVVVHIANHWQNLWSWFNNKGRALPGMNAKTNLFQLKEHKMNKLRHDFQHSPSYTMMTT